MINPNLVFVGIKGTVVAAKRATGQRLWETPLKGSDFVNVISEKNGVYATTHGEIFCLEPHDGQIRWHNRLKGMGVGLASIAVSSKVFVGIKGGVVALDLSVGTIDWQTPLKGADFVNLICEEGHLYATAHGEIFCLDATDGAIGWHDPLRGMGWGLASVAIANAPSGGPAILVAEQRRRQAAAAAAAAT